jgi:BlaI family penicillinase repressor
MFMGVHPWFQLFQIASFWFGPIFTPVKITLDGLYTCRDDAPVLTPIIAMPEKPIELTEAEWTIIKAVWENEPCTAPAIQEKLFAETSWTYSTVRTLMDRMVGKKLLTANREKNVTLYHTAVTRTQAQRGELLYALKHAFNGALTPMVQCLLDTKDVSRAELDQIKQLIAAHEKSRGKTAKKP